MGANTGVYEMGDGTWVAAIQYQDGVERRSCRTREEAIASVVKDHQFWNGVAVAASEVPVYRRVLRATECWEIE